MKPESVEVYLTKYLRVVSSRLPNILRAKNTCFLRKEIGFIFAKERFSERMVFYLIF